MGLEYLVFDESGDEEGHGSFDAMAGVPLERLPALQAEVLRVLQWAEAQFPGGRAPLEEGGEWDCELQGVREVATTLDVEVTADGTALHLQPQPASTTRITLSLTLVGSESFCEAFRAAFGGGP